MSSSNCDIDDSIFTLEYADSVSGLAKAVKAGDLEAVKKLILKGRLPQTPDNRGWTAMHWIAYTKNIEMLKLVLELKPESKEYLVNLLTWEDGGPLHVALRVQAPFEMIQLLLEAGAEASTALYEACKVKGNLEVVKLLFRHGAVADAQDITLSTPLHYAVTEARDLDMIKYLIDISDLRLVNVKGKCAFVEACRMNFMEAVRLFIEKDKSLANLSSPKPPLIYACMWENVEMAELFVNSGADVHCKCEASIFLEPGQIDFSFERIPFFPIHSSMNNVKVFELLLSRTSPAELLKLENKFYNFALYLLLFGKTNSFYETLMQSEYPSVLKTIKCKTFVHFILKYPVCLELYIMKAFWLIFKYNFSFDPDNVFQDLVCQLSNIDIETHFTIFHSLARMGVSSSDQFDNKRTVIGVLENLLLQEDVRDVRSTCDLLSVPVLTLKQYCRVAVRRAIKREVDDDWLAYRMVKESDLPECLKKFLFFEELRLIQ